MEWTREALQIGTRPACSALQRVSLLTEVFETRLAPRSPFVTLSCASAAGSALIY